MNSTATHQTLAVALDDLEVSLRALQWWQEQSPPAQALASTQPFALDTLRFPQWLQFLFIPKLKALADNANPLPGNCSVAPMAEEYCRAQGVSAPALVSQLQMIDRLLTQ
ncbi:YqcC family protein [Gilvimarinus sp. 1_MG-2023]|uniref:YqcC family protein n=1 Tax=Gilvimarinus sp. 1_MG-2023 TaxID=3062638 RepID=UPI0026E18C6F|nr:YqcC family protein [Gilvimarinus sp. 1_MG-2023]MDO6747432.1 YqcC family protein [Gilvimarinus sp. 1_MG-2023]